MRLYTVSQKKQQQHTWLLIITSANVDRFLPCDAMLARYICSRRVRPSVCPSFRLLHTLVLCQNGRLNIGSHRQRRTIARELNWTVLALRRCKRGLSPRRFTESDSHCLYNGEKINDPRIDAPRHYDTDTAPSLFLFTSEEEMALMHADCDDNEDR